MVYLLSLSIIQEAFLQCSEEERLFTVTIMGKKVCFEGGGGGEGAAPRHSSRTGGRL